MNPYYNPKLVSEMRTPNMDYLRMQNPNIQMPTSFGSPQSSNSSNFFQNNQWTSSDTSGVGQIGTMATQLLPPPEDDRFSVDPNAGFKGSFAGLGQAGVIGAIAGGIGAQVGEFSKVNKNLAKLDRSVSAYEKDAFGNPIYQGGEVTQARNTVNELEAGQKKINRSIDPATRIFSGLFGTKKKLRRAKRQVGGNLKQAQAAYNTAEQKSVNRRNAADEFYDRNNKYARMNNLVPPSFSQMY